MDQYTQTRISRPYLERLRQLAKRHKRSMAMELEALIDIGESIDRADSAKPLKDGFSKVLK